MAVTYTITSTEMTTAATFVCLLVVIAPTAHVKRVFDIVSLSELVAIDPGLESALERIARRREQTAG